MQRQNDVPDKVQYEGTSMKSRVENIEAQKTIVDLRNEIKTLVFLTTESPPRIVPNRPESNVKFTNRMQLSNDEEQ